MWWWVVGFSLEWKIRKISKICGEKRWDWAIRKEGKKNEKKKEKMLVIKKKKKNWKRGKIRNDAVKKENDRIYNAKE